MAGLVHGGAEVQAMLRAYLQEHLLGDPHMGAGHGRHVAGGRPEARAEYWVSECEALVVGPSGRQRAARSSAASSQEARLAQKRLEGGYALELLSLPRVCFYVRAHVVHACSYLVAHNGCGCPQRLPYTHA